MRSGHMFLLDELSLAEDAVLERLNSVLEPSRRLTLAEQGGAEVRTVVTAPVIAICSAPLRHTRSPAAVRDWRVCARAWRGGRLWRSKPLRISCLPPP